MHLLFMHKIHAHTCTTDTQLVHPGLPWSVSTACTSTCIVQSHWARPRHIHNTLCAHSIVQKATRLAEQPPSAAKTWPAAAAAHVHAGLPGTPNPLHNHHTITQCSQCNKAHDSRNHHYTPLPPPLRMWQQHQHHHPDQPHQFHCPSCNPNIPSAAAAGLLKPHTHTQCFSQSMPRV